MRKERENERYSSLGSEARFVDAREAGADEGGVDMEAGLRIADAQEPPPALAVLDVRHHLLPLRAASHTPLPLTPPRKRRLPERKRKNETKTRKAYEDEVLQVLCRVHSVLLAVSKRRMRTRKKEGSM